MALRNAGPVGPVGTTECVICIASSVLPRSFRILFVVVMFDAVAQLFQAHRRHYAFDSDRLARIDQHPFARVVSRAVGSGVLPLFQASDGHLSTRQ